MNLKALKTKAKVLLMSPEIIGILIMTFAILVFIAGFITGLWYHDWTIA